MTSNCQYIAANARPICCDSFSISSILTVPSAWVSVFYPVFVDIGTFLIHKDLQTYFYFYIFTVLTVPLIVYCPSAGTV